jgi:hypothetical protein
LSESGVSQHQLNRFLALARHAMGIRGVNDARLNQLGVGGFVPFEVRVDGTRLSRREHSEVVANAWDARWAGQRAPDRV